MHNSFDKTVYLHTHALTAGELTRALQLGQPLEIDVSVDDHGRNYVGHPYSWYVFHKQPLPHNVALQTAVHLAERSKDPVVLDIKDFHEAETVVKLAQKIGTSHCLIHAFAADLVFDERENEAEPHRQNENMSFDILKFIKQATRCPMILAARGMNSAVATQADDLRQRLEKLRGVMDYFNPNIPSVYDTDALQALLRPLGIGQLIDVDNQKVPHYGHWIGFTEKEAHV